MGKKFTLTKKFRFETAHRLTKGYQGKCNHIHGHSWNGKIAVTALELDEVDMAVDFKILGRFCKMVEERYDHKLLLWEKDPLIECFPLGATDIVETEGNPTSEYLAEEIYNLATEFFRNYKCEIEYIQVDETCTSECIFTK